MGKNILVKYFSLMNYESHVCRTRLGGKGTTKVGGQFVL